MKKIFLFNLILCFCFLGCAGSQKAENQSGSNLQTIVDLWNKIKPVQGPVSTPLPAEKEPGPEVLPVSPAPITPPPPVPAVSHVVICDFDKIPDMMRAQGWQGTDNQLFFALFSTYGSHEWGYVGTDPVAINLYNSGGAIKDWFSSYVSGIGNQLKANSGMTATIILNDRNDAGGCFLGQPIMNQLKGMGVPENQLTMGDIYQP